MDRTAASSRLRGLAAVLAVLAAAWVTGLGQAQASNAVVQNGLQNYAGPACPGTDWTCTKNTSNVRQTTAGGKNRFECAKGNVCKAKQVASGGADNEASCSQSTLKAGKQSCSIEQSNDTGSNTLNSSLLDASLSTTKSEATQSSGQTFLIVQTNDTGPNTIDITQHISHSIDSKKGKKHVHVQEARQFAGIRQQSTSGKQDLRLEQIEDLSSVATSAKKTTEQQNTSKKPCPAWPKGPLNDKPECPNTGAAIYQHTSSGQQHATVTQTQNLTQDATTPRAVQRQGADLGGEDIVWDIDAISADHSIASATQRKTWTQHASAAKDQIQNDKLKLRSVGLSPDETTVDQKSELKSDLGAQQDCEIEGEDLHTKTSGAATTSCTLDDGDGTPEHSDGTHPISTDPTDPTDYHDESKTPTTISGTVTDASTGQALAGATLNRYYLVSGNPATATAIADADGRYKFEGIAAQPATSTVEASNLGYDNASVTNIAVPEDGQRVVDFRLTPKPITAGARPAEKRAAPPTATQEQKHRARRR